MCFVTYAAATRQAEMAAKDEHAAEELKRAVLLEAQKQAEQVDIVIEDVARASERSREEDEEVCVPSLSPLKAPRPTDSPLL